MTTRRTTEPGRNARADESPAPRIRSSTGGALSHRHAGPRSRDEAEERYVAARDAWTAAMRQALSGKPADLASLAITQEAYEAASMERERWRISGRVALPIEADAPHAGIDAVVGQELAWRRVHQVEPKRRGLIGRLAGKLRGR